MIDNKFDINKKISLIISAFILVSTLLQPVSYLIDLASDSNGIELLELTDQKDNKENENSEPKDNSIEKNKIEGCFYPFYFEVLTIKIKIFHPQKHDPFVMDILLPPPENCI